MTSIPCSLRILTYSLCCLEACEGLTVLLMGLVEIQPTMLLDGGLTITRSNSLSMNNTPDFGPKRSSVYTEKCYPNVHKPRAIRNYHDHTQILTTASVVQLITYVGT